MQEIQDADGAGNGTDLSGEATAQVLIDAIFARSGGTIQYTYVEVAPDKANSTGGEPGGNIRNGYLYLADRVSLVDGSLGIVEDAAFATTRRPLVATWSFNGQQVTTINVHFTSRGGSDPLFGATQPPANAGEAARIAQAKAVGDYVNDQLAGDPDQNFAILGDWNGFYFEEQHTQLTDGVFTNLAGLLPAAERYSYLFDGNSQLLDNILVTSGLVANARYDAIHINAEFTGVRPTDHDPQLAVLRMAAAPRDLVISNATVAENLAAGAIVGTLSATDTRGELFRFALLDDAEGRFAVDERTGVVTTTRALDFEAAASFVIRAIVTDAVGLTSDRALTIAVGDVNEAPVAASDMIALSEDATSANLWSQLLGNDIDVDAGDTLSIAAVDASRTLGTLVFDPATQSLRYVADNDAFDALAPGATAVDSFRYTVTDRAGLSSTATVSVTVTGIADGIATTGGNGNDVMPGTAGEDRLFGDNGDDRLDGLAGHDRLEGGRGNDTLDGGIGIDLLVGGQGDDTLAGGAGADTFRFDSKSGNDVILDFNTAQDALSFADNTGIRSSQSLDANRDGIADLLIALNGGGSVTLYGVSTLADVVVGGIPAIHAAGGQSLTGWAVAPADESGGVMHGAVDHLLYGY